MTRREGVERGVDVGVGGGPADARGAASGGRRRPWPRAPATARGTPTSTRSRSGRRCRPGRGRAARPGVRRRRRRGTRGGGARSTGRRRPRDAGDRAPRRRTAASVSASLLGGLGGQRVASSSAHGRAEARRWRATFSSPARRARSWSPPTSSGAQPQAPPHEQRADARRAAELVGADRHEVGAERVEVDRHVPGGLGGVDVDEHAAVAARGHHLGRPAARADLVVAPLQVHERGVGSDRGEHGVDVDAADARRRHDHRARRAPHWADASAHGRVLDRGARPRAPPARRRPASTAAAIASVAPLVNTTSR